MQLLTPLNLLLLLNATAAAVAAAAAAAAAAVEMPCDCIQRVSCQSRWTLIGTCECNRSTKIRYYVSIERLRTKIVELKGVQVIQLWCIERHYIWGNEEFY